MAKPIITKQKTEKETSIGKCRFCEDEFAKGKMTQHLKVCKARLAKNREQEGQDEEPFHLLVEGKYRPEYWMHLEVPARAQLFDLDDFLRAFWVECCEHLSSFELGGVSYDMQGPTGIFSNGFNDNMLQIVGSDGVPVSNVIRDGLPMNSIVEEEVIEEEQEDDSEPPVDLIAEQLTESLTAEFHADLKDVPIELIEGKLEQMLTSDVTAGMIPPSMINDIKPFINYMATLLQKGELGNMLEEMDESGELDEDEEDADADVTLGDILDVGRKFTYTYDFGSSTTLTFRVLGQRAGVVPDLDEEDEDEGDVEKDVDEGILDEEELDDGEDEEEISILIMAQNDAPNFVCHLCGKPATKVSQAGSEHVSIAGVAFCDACAQKSESPEEMLPIVNSPRVGICGYDGGAGWVDEEWEEEEEEEEERDN